jgi:tripartite-type tricarboxylate transporter receptor subunit TctC
MSAEKAFLRASIATAALMAAFTAPSAWADYPDRPVRIIVPFAAGSGTDVVARATGAALSARMGVPVMIENTVGSDGAVGTQAVAKAGPDGYTLLATSNPFTLAPHVTKSPPYDPVRDFVAVARIAVIPLALVTSATSSFKTFDDLVAYMRQNPGKARYATSGKGALSHLEVEVMNRYLNVQAQDQPYRSAKDAVGAAANGKADFFLANLPMAQAQLNSGSLRALAVTSGARIPQTRGVPTLAEAMRRPGYEATVWFGLVAPAGTPPQVIQRLENEIERELEVPAVSARIETIGGRVAFQRSAPFSGQLRLEHAKWAQAVKALQPSPQ